MNQLPRLVPAVLALASSAAGCSLTLANDYTFPDGGGADAPTADVARADVPLTDGPVDGGGCRVDGDCTGGPPSTRGRCASGACTYECEGSRGDCDGIETNGCEVDLGSDRDHCGGCDRACALAANTSPSCAARVCVYECRAGFADCETSSPDCETTLGVGAACAACGDACDVGEVCDTTGTTNVCASTCTMPSVVCGTACVDVASSLAHCGGCDRPCTGRDASWSCAAGSCAVAACDMGFGDCDGRDDTGCEVSTNTSLVHCGGCDRPCAPAHAIGACATGSCGIAACDLGYDDCNGTAADGCETDLGSLTDCGGCGQVCDLANASESCGAARSCVLGACDAGYSDCDGIDSTGCESALATDAMNCGACGRACPAGAACVAGVCDPVRAVGTGLLHSCALRDGGVVSCWGTNEAGQLGDGGLATRGTPAPVTGPLRFDAISVGQSFTCAIERGTGRLHCWGRAGYGELGSGARTNSSSPVPVVARAADAAAFGARSFVEIVTLTSGACARDSMGDVWCWGRNVYGEVGDGTTNVADAAVRVAGVIGALGLAAGNNHACARTATDVRCWGYNAFGQLGDATSTNRTSPTVVTGLGATLGLAATSQATCAIEPGSQVTCWGRNDVGELGDGTTTRRSIPGRNGVVATELRCGGDRCFALTSGGYVGWGNRANGELGDGVEGLPALSAIPLPHPSTMTITVGITHACGIDGGRLSCWGADFFGTLGVRDLTLRASAPVATLGVPLTGITALAAGGFSSWVIAGGRLYGAGINDTGILARTSPYASAIPLEVSGIGSPVSDVAAGRNFACSISGAIGVRQVHCWGSSTAIAASATPTLRPITGGEPIAIAAGYDHVCAIVDEGGGRRVPYCWGSNALGQLGRGGTGAPDPTPTAVAGLTDVVELELGHATSCARTATGTVACWGTNGSGQLGDGTTTTRTSPTPVPGLTGIVDLAVGASHACAVRGDGTMACWGAGGDGQLGTGTPSSSPSPLEVTVLGGRLANAATASGRHTCALSGGVAFCWGSNADGQLGTGDRRPVSGLSTIMAVTSGTILSSARNSGAEASHTCVRQSDGTARCWGLGTLGRLGSGEDLTLATPTPVLLTY